MIPLTELAHTTIRTVLQPGDIAIDATAGNGHDTKFLAECVGSAGTVYSFDVQAAAIEITQDRLATAGLGNVVLLKKSHAEMRSTLPPQITQRVSAVMLNLGYLPGGDKRQTTQLTSTLAAIRDGLILLAPGGIMTILAYPGHLGGADETAAVELFLSQLPRTGFEVHEPGSAVDKNLAPRLFVIRKMSANIAGPGNENDAPAID